MKQSSEVQVELRGSDETEPLDDNVEDTCNPVAVLFLYVASISVTVYGSVYIDDCPAGRMVAISLIVIGSLNTLYRILSYAYDDRKICNSDNVQQIIVTEIIFHLIQLVIVGWFLALCYWVFTMKPDTKPEDRGTANYCESSFYYITYYGSIGGLIFLGLIITSVCLGFLSCDTVAVLWASTSVIVYGSAYIHDCPAERMVAISLIVIGSLNILYRIFSNTYDYRKICNSYTMQKQKVVVSIVLLIQIVVLGWFFAVCYWVFTMKPDTKAEDRGTANYCDSNFYHRTYYGSIGGLIFLGTLFTCVCCSVRSWNTVVVLIRYVASIFLIVAGSVYIDDCPAERMVAISLIVIGSLNILSRILNSTYDYRKICNSTNVQQNIVIKRIILLIDFVILGWFFAVYYWVFSMKPDTKPEDRGTANYCDFNFYHNTYYGSIGGLVVHGTLFTCFCCAVGYKKVQHGSQIL